MKRNFFTVFLIVLLCCVFGCQQGEDVVEDPAADMEADKEAIFAWYNQKTEVTNDGDYDGLKILFDENIIFMPPN